MTCACFASAQETKRKIDVSAYKQIYDQIRQCYVSVGRGESKNVV